MRRSTRQVNATGDASPSPSKVPKLNGHHNGNSLEDKEVYKIDEFVFYETSPSEPYGIGKITDLSKNANGFTVAKLTTFVRRNTTSGHVKASAEVQDRENAKDYGIEFEMDHIPDDVKTKVLQRELFITKESVMQPVSTFRGKCIVLGLCEVDSRQDFSSRSDHFYYVLQYDRALQPSLKFPDRGEIRVGSKYQAEIPALLADKSQYPRKCDDLETLTFRPNDLTTSEVTDYLKGFTQQAAAARYNSGWSKYSESAKCAFLAQRDSTIQKAHDHLHRCDYDTEKALAAVEAKPELCFAIDPLESWTDLERTAFYKLLRIHKDFPKMRPLLSFCKPYTSLVDYYYLWKTTEQCEPYRKERTTVGAKKMKYVAFNSQAKIFSSSVAAQLPIRCDHCKSPINYVFEITPKKLCSFCFSHWKKYYSFPAESQLLAKQKQLEQQKLIEQQKAQEKSQHKADQEQQRPEQQPKQSQKSGGSGSTNGAISKGKAPFYYRAVEKMKDAREESRDTLNLKRVAKNPFEPINARLFQAEVNERLSHEDSKGPINRKLRVYVCKKIQNNPKLAVTAPVPSWLVKSPKKEASAKSSSASVVTDGTNGTSTTKMTTPMASLKRRGLVAPSILDKSAGDSSDICYVSTERDRQLRKQLTARQLRHHARNPHSPIALSSSTNPSSSTTAAEKLSSSVQNSLPSELPASSATTSASSKTRSSTKGSSSSSAAAAAIAAAAAQNLLPLNHPAFGGSSGGGSSGNSAAAAVTAALMANPLAARGAAAGSGNPLANFSNFAHLSQSHQAAALMQLFQSTNQLNSHFPNGFMNFAQSSNGRTFNGSSGSGSKHSK